MLKFRSFSTFFRCFKSIHGRAVIGSKRTYIFSGRAGDCEGKSVFNGRNILWINPCTDKPFLYVTFNAPKHRADESFRRWRKIRCADFKNLGNERWIAGNPVAHDDSSTRHA